MPWHGTLTAKIVLSQAWFFCPTLPCSLKSTTVLMGGASQPRALVSWLGFSAAAFYTLMLNIVTSEAASTRRQKRADFRVLHSATCFW